MKDIDLSSPVDVGQVGGQTLGSQKCATIPCAQFHAVKIKLHNHFLNLIYSPHEINKRDNMFCRIAVTRSIKSMQLIVVNNVVMFYTQNV
jgi:hypothetical protein